MISSPASTHAQFVTEALHSNLQVWVEKPFACDLLSRRHVSIWQNGVDLN